ncbi:MAG: CDP-glycerol glycerophosphotransferase family protein [Lachnospiraceae bacterium]|nr:CDP-glycerol glycerophosphotransferase family protein [Lachnospiraceae bacterium]
MINNHARKGVSCNPKYMATALQKRYGNSIEIFWVSEYPESCRELDAMGISVIRANSWEHVRKFFTAIIYITNDSFPHWARHRKNQLWINTWHGAMNYKHIGYDYLPAMSILGRKLFRLKNRKPDIFVAGSRFFAEDTAESFRLPADIFLPCGLPRNDLFFKSDQIMRQRILKELDVSDTKKVVLYAPTFRDSGRSSAYGMNFTQLRSALQRRFGGDWVVLFRNHSFVTKETGNTVDAKDVSEYPDMQELLLVADVLISDYSSCMWDFSLLKRPCFVYAPDLNDYQEHERNFAYPIERWPYPITKTNEDLMNCILHFKEKNYLEKLEKHHEDAGRLDDGMATQRLLERINLSLLE